MRNTRARSMVLVILTLLFMGGVGLFVFRFVTNASNWVLSPINKHFSGTKAQSSGDIVDRNNITLAHSDGAERKYHSDETTRRALLHTVGDSGSNIPTAVQTLYRDELHGYNFIFGVNPPEILRKSNNIKITLDSDVCRTALSALGARKGAVCVYNYKTGEIICMVSSPAYDPYHPEVVARDKVGAYEGAYINRVLNASYAPGSVFKVVTGAAALSNLPDAESRTYSCQHIRQIDGKKITCMGHHGDISLKNAMMRSCNIYFADLAIDLGHDVMTKTANALGFNQSFRIDRVSTKASHYDVATADAYSLGWSGVGQHTDLLNPMHGAIIMGAIANGGNAVTPRFVREVYADNPSKNAPTANNGSKTLMDSGTAGKLAEIMRYNVTANYGDGAFRGLKMCAKTGTAEVGEGKEPHGWVLGFSAEDRVPLAFAVIVENGGFGGRCALPIASLVMKKAADRLT